jgi:hypothetical protein
MSETQISKSIMDYLAARRVLAFRMNTGAVSAEYKGKTRFMRFGVPGMADILAFTRRWPCLIVPDKHQDNPIIPTWIEVKTAKGKQSELQKSFQAQVEAEGHRYAVVRSIDDVEALLRR